MVTPLFSIITINLNNAKGLQRTLHSIQQQSWQQFELVVVDGGSTDDSIRVIKTFGKMITSIISEKDEGIYHAMNKGWQMCTGKFCLFLNAGDTLHKATALQDVRAVLEKGEADFYYGNIVGIGLNGRQEITRFAEPVSLHYLFRWYLPHPASFIKRELLLAQNGYAQHYRIIADWIFSVQVFLKGHRFQHIDTTISDFYADGISSTQHDLAANEKKVVFENELAHLQPDWLWYQKMRPLELSRPVQWLAAVLKKIKTSR